MMEDISSMELKIENSLSHMDIYRTVANETVAALAANGSSEKLNQLKSDHQLKSASYSSRIVELSQLSSCFSRSSQRARGEAPGERAGEENSRRASEVRSQFCSDVFLDLFLDLALLQELSCHRCFL